jgi:hypothetical protein
VALFAAFGLIAGAFYLGLTRGEGDIKGSASVLGLAFLAINFVNAFCSIFLLFGPGASLGIAANVTVLGLHIVVISALGFYVAYTNGRAQAKFLFALIVVTILCLAGTFPWLGHNVAIWSTVQVSRQADMRRRMKRMM